MTISKRPKIFVTGDRGMVGSALVRRLEAKGYNNLLVRTGDELDLLDQRKVHAFLAERTPDSIFIAAAKVGGIHANNRYHYGSAQRDSLVKQAGFQAYDYHE